MGLKIGEGFRDQNRDITDYKKGRVKAFQIVAKRLKIEAGISDRAGIKIGAEHKVL